MEEQLLISEEHCAVKIVEEQNSSIDYNIRKGAAPRAQGSIKFEKEADEHYTESIVKYRSVFGS
jgi:hypothetical protein